MDSMETDESFDTSILAFGGSASVNTDLRRSIKKEIEEIDASITKTKKETNVESAVASELNKGISNAVKESRTLCYRSEQTLDALKLNHQVAQGLYTTFKDEISSSEALLTVEKNPAADENSAPGYHRTWLEMRESMTLTKDAFDKHQELMNSSLQNIRNLVLQKKEIEADSSEHIVEDYERRLAALKDRCESADQVLRDEKDRNSALKRTQEKEAEVERNLDAELERLSKHLSTMKKENEAEEKDKRKIIEAENEEIVRLRNEILETDKTINSLRSQKESIEIQIKRVGELVLEREQAKSTLQAKREARNKVYSEKRELASLLLALKKELDHCNRDVLKQEEIKKVLEKERDANDEMEATWNTQGKETLEKIEKDNSKMKEIELNNEVNKETEILETEIKEVTEKTKAMEEELSALKRELEQKRAKEDSITKNLEALDSSTSDETKLKKEELANIQQEMDLLTKELEELEANKAARLVQAKRAEADIKLYILKLGASMLKKTAAKEKEAEA